MRVAIIGCGLIGTKRAKALGKHELVIAADIQRDRAQAVVRLAKGPGFVTTNWQEAAGHPDVDLIIVATHNALLTPVGAFALEQGKHVLIEKPAARSAQEVSKLKDLAEQTGRKVKVGFNLRYHPSLIKAKNIVEQGGVGDLMFIRGRYGHGGRIGYDKEWRANPEISGGGELIDQGVHLIDLSRWFLGDLNLEYGYAPTYFWDMPVDDNGFMALKAKGGQMAWLHVSCSEWKNMFCMEIYGRTGKLQIDGIGGTYGVERLSYYRMLPEMGPPETTIWEFPGEDRSWVSEFDAFIEAIERDYSLCGDVNDAYAALKIVDQVYRRN